MKTIKLLSFFIVATVILSSCDAIADTLAKDVEGTTNINFTTKDAPLTAPSGLQKANNAIEGVIAYDSVLNTAQIDAELEKVNMTRDNIRSITLTLATFTLPTTTAALGFVGAKLYVDGVLVAQQEGTIEGLVAGLVIKDATAFENAVNNGGRIIITTPIKLPKGLAVSLALHYIARVSLIATTNS
jgi:hypothetical protein